MVKERTKKVLTWDRSDYVLTATEVSYIVGLPPGTVLEPAPLLLESGWELRVGDEVRRLAGPRTGAGCFRFESETPVIYQGLYRCSDGAMACFTQEMQVEHLKRHDPDHDTYYAWVWLEKFRRFVFTTNNLASRLIETSWSRCSRALEQP